MATRQSENWDANQQAVIEAASTNRMLVEAGPGTGKTAVACAKVAHLIDVKNVDPSKIWLLSFTRTAVRELRDRIGTYVADSLDAMSVKITTLDSQVWYLRQGLEDSNFERLFGSYEANIEKITELLRDNDPGLLEYLREIQHIIVDEAQDLVGVRAELVCELIRHIPGTCGITVFSDSAQAIYGFTYEAGSKGNGKCTELVPELKSGKYGTVDEHMLQTIYRTNDAGLADAYRELRKLALSPDVAKSEKREILREQARGRAKHTLSNKVVEQSLKGRADTLVLFRYRIDVLQASSFLWSANVSHKLRMSGIPQRLSPWIARIFWDCQEKLISEETFDSLWAKRVSTKQRFDEDAKQRAWASLLAYCGTRRGSAVELKQLRRVLSRSKPPIEFTLSDDMLPGPVLGTIHASKGREADIVHLMLPDYCDLDVGKTPEQIDEEGRVIFVGATRAKSELNVGSTGRPYASSVPNGRRTYKLGKRNKSPRAQVEFGLSGDVDKHRLLLREEWADSDESAESVQEYLWEHCLDHVRVIAEKSEETSWNYWLHAEDESCDWLGSLSKRVTSDFWPIADRVKEHHRRERAWPGPTIRHLHMVGSESVVLGETDDMRAQLLEPWSRSGIYLVPVVSGFTNVYFSG